MLQGYVINLDRHSDRLFSFYQQPDARYFHRVSAVDKKLLDLFQSDALFFNSRALEHKINRKVTLGEIGCTLSHIKTWQIISENTQLAEDDFAVVAEDDICLIDNFGSYLQAILPSLKETEADIVILQKLGLYSAEKVELFDGRELSYFIPSISQQVDNDGSSLYLIRKSKAIELTQQLTAQKPNWLADHFSVIAELNKIFILSKMFGYIPESSLSDLEDERNVARNEAKIGF